MAEEGLAAARSACDVFAATKSHTGAGTQWSFTGEQNDANGLEYLRARYYDPALGRFLTRDPFAGLVAVPQSLNRYPYVLNDPVNFADPSGLQCGWDVWNCPVEVPSPSIPFFRPVHVEWPDIPLPEFNPHPLENWKDWWNWVRRSDAKTSEPDFTPWTPNPREPGQILPPGFEPPGQGPYKWMARAVLAAMGVYALEESGVLNMCRPPKE